MAYYTRPFGNNIRMAVPDDILRLAMVSLAGYEYTDTLEWESPFRHSEPGSTLASFCQEMKMYLESPKHMVLVRMGEHDPKESENTKAIMPNHLWPPLLRWVAPARGELVIVSVAVWKLRPGESKPNVPIVQSCTSTAVAEPERSIVALGRSMEMHQVMRAAESKHLLNDMLILERLVTHPAYWGKSHATNLFGWGADLAMLQRINIGAIATRQGRRLLWWLACEELEKVHVDGDYANMDGFDLWVMRYTLMR